MLTSIALLLMAAEPLLLVTPANLANQAACRASAASSLPDAGELETWAQVEARQALERKAVTEARVRKHGFVSLKQYQRFEVRVAALVLDGMDDAAVATEVKPLAEYKAGWREKVAKGEMTKEELARRIDIYGQAISNQEKSRARVARRKEPQSSLASSGNFEEDAEAKKEAESQPPLSDAERKAWAAWMKRK